MKMVIEIETDNAAFDDNMAEEINACLDRLKDNVERKFSKAEPFEHIIKDSNGNAIGFAHHMFFTAEEKGQP